MTLIFLGVPPRFSASRPFRGRREHMAIGQNLFIRAVKTSPRNTQQQKTKTCFVFQRMSAALPDSGLLLGRRLSYIFFPLCFSRNSCLWHNTAEALPRMTAKSGRNDGTDADSVVPKASCIPHCATQDTEPQAETRDFIQCSGAQPGPGVS